MKSKNKAFIIIISLGLLLLGGIYVDKVEATAEKVALAGSETRVITDMAGDQIEIPAVVNRSVVLSMYPIPSVITTFLGSGSKVVGMDPFAYAAAENGLLGKIFPDILNADISFMDGNNVNIESLINLKPDVVFCGARNEKQKEMLRNAGLIAIGVEAGGHNYNCIKTYNDWFELMNQVFPGEGPSQDKITEYSQEKYDLIQERVSDIPEEERTRALYVFRYNDKQLMIAGENFFGNWWIETAGGINVAAEVTARGSQPATLEQIYQWNSDVIFLTNFSSAMPEDLENKAINNDDWSPVKAVQEKRVHKHPLGSYRTYTPGVDTPVTMLWVAKQMYPERFKDIDIAQEFKDYYKNFFNVDLTDEDVTSILNPPREAAGIW